MMYKHDSATQYIRASGRMYRIRRGYTYEVVPDSKALAPVKGGPVPQMSASVYESITGKTFAKPKPPATKAAAKAPAKKATKKTSKKTVKKNGDSD